MTWDQWIVLLLGVPAIGMTQVESLRRWACFPGIGGQLGWFGGLQDSQPAFLIASILCCAIWLYSLWKFWLSGSPATDTTLTVGPGGGASEPPKPPQKARLRIVPKRP